MAVNESASGAFWDDINNQSMSAFMRSGNDPSSNHLAVNQSIIDDYGSAQEITNQITNKLYKTSVKPSYLVNKGAAAPGAGPATADFSINGEGANNSSFNSSSMMDHSANNSKMVNNPSQ